MSTEQFRRRIQIPILAAICPSRWSLARVVCTCSPSTCRLGPPDDRLLESVTVTDPKRHSQPPWSALAGRDSSDSTKGSRGYRGFHLPASRRT